LIPSPPGWSQDANWFWDGLKWNDAISPDGKYRFDGREWRKFHGERSLMPPEPLHPLATEGPPPAPPGPPAVELPTWVDQSEVERLEKEKRDQEAFAAHAALPQIPLPPESDWRRVGEHMQFSHRGGRVESLWAVGGTSIVIFLVLFLFCSPAALIFTWLTAWKMDSKVIVTLLLLAPGVIYLILILTGTVPPPSPR